MPRSLPGGIYLDFEEAPGMAQGGGAGVNRLCAEVLRSAFPVSEDPVRADLRVKTFSWDAPARPRRLFIDHGSFADAGFWSYSAPKLRFDDTILVASRVCVEVARRFIQGEGPRVQCVPFPVDIETFRPVEDRRERGRALRGELGIPQDAALLLVVSAFVRRKNQHVAVQFLRALLDEIPDAHLVFVGGTPRRGTGEAYRAAVRDLAVGEGVASSVHFLGELPHPGLSRCMAAADLLIHFTNCRLENFGLVVGEALAAGLPVVAADWGGLRDLVVAGETGILAPTYLTDQGPRTDWRSVVGPAAEILKNSDEWARMSVNARKRAERELSTGAYRRRLCAAVEAALARPPDERPLSLTPQGTDLMFRTLTLNASHPEIEGTGDEYRLLMPLDGGRHYRLLTGPAASRETAPRVDATHRLYPIVRWSRQGSTVRITDPAWPATLTIDATPMRILELCDGTRTLEDVFLKMALPADRRPSGMQSAQVLVDQGILCPLGGVPVRRTAE